MTSDFDYKKYSLENLETWMSDALVSSEATPQEIYDVIHKVVEEEYHYFKHHTGRCYDLLALLNGNGNQIIEQVKAQGEVWDKEDACMPPWGHSDLEYGIANPTLTEDRISNFPGEQYTEEDLNAMCDKAASDQEKEKCREYNMREAEYYDKRAQLDLGRNRTYDEMISDGYWMTDDGFWMPPKKEDKVVKWQLPVEIDGISGEYFVQFPDDLMEAADIKENDMVEWVDQEDGSYLLHKVTKPIEVEKF